jgi:hypothetical protein
VLSLPLPVMRELVTRGHRDHPSQNDMPTLVIGFLVVAFLVVLLIVALQLTPPPSCWMNFLSRKNLVDGHFQDGLPLNF